MNITQKTLAAVLVSSTALVSAASAAEVTANVGATTDYIWRGMTQNDGGSSLSGGLDVDFGNGFYAGTWIGDTAAAADPTAETDYGTQEVDFYAGYAGESGSVSYDVGYIAYTYPSSQSDADADFSELYVTLGTGPVSASVYYLADAEGADAGDSTYLSLDYEGSVGDFGLGLHYGSYDGDFVGDETQTDMSITLSKDAFSYSLITTEELSGVDDDARFVISWGQEF